jgi:hypothetical protein
MAKTDENRTDGDRGFLGINLSSKTERANYLARIFAIFYEKLLEIWLKTKGFELLGRPTVYDKDWKSLRKTFDYTLKKNGKYFIVEAKCYLAYDNFRQLVLTTKSLESMLSYGDNFQFFCEVGTEKEPYEKYCFGTPGADEEFKPDGKILLWSKVNRSEEAELKIKYKFSDIFSIEDAINDMVKEAKNDSSSGKEYSGLVSKYKEWTDELFNKLIG